MESRLALVAGISFESSQIHSQTENLSGKKKMVEAYSLNGEYNDVRIEYEDQKMLERPWRMKRSRKILFRYV